MTKTIDSIVLFFVLFSTSIASSETESGGGGRSGGGGGGAGGSWRLSWMSAMALLGLQVVNKAFESFGVSLSLPNRSDQSAAIE